MTEWKTAVWMHCGFFYGLLLPKFRIIPKNADLIRERYVAAVCLYPGACACGAALAGIVRAAARAPYFEQPDEHALMRGKRVVRRAWIK